MSKKESKKTTSKLNFYFALLNHLKNPKINQKKICKDLGISKQNLYYHRKKLQELGFLKKDKSVWIVLKSKKEDLEHALNWKDKKIRGHAFIWKVKPIRNFEWKTILERKKIKYNLVRGHTPRIFIDNKKIWLAKETIIVYETKSFYGKDAFESRKLAVFELMKTLQSLKNKLGVEFKYLFMTTREHYGMIKNELARQVNDKGEKIIVRDYLDGEWLWVDDSTGMMGELETGGKGFTQDRASLNKGVQKWYNDMKKTKFQVTPTFLMESINKVTKNQQMFAQNMESHVGAVQKLGNSAEANALTVELLAQKVAELTEEVKKLGRNRS